MAEYSSPIHPNMAFGPTANWSNFSLHRDSCKTSFDLPFPSEKLFLLAQGRVSGSVNIIQSPDRTEDEGVVTVEIVARYSHAPDLGSIRVCRITCGNNENGVGIMAPYIPDDYGVNLSFEITMCLPKASSGRSSLRVKNLETNLPLFAHYTGNLADTIDFDNIFLKTSNMPIEIVSLYARNAHMVTSNSHIEGDFEISSSLKLLTANSYIKAKVDLFNDEDAGGTDITMNTSNAPINATLSLISARASDIGGKFNVSATTALGAVNLTFLRAPVDSTLILDAFTSLSAATVKLHETYEGSFNLTTTWNTPGVVVDYLAKDPRGEGRRRIVNVENDVGCAMGTILWGNRRSTERGVVNVGTSLAPLAFNV